MILGLHYTGPVCSYLVVSGHLIQPNTNIPIFTWILKQQTIGKNYKSGTKYNNIITIDSFHSVLFTGSGRDNFS